MSNKFQIPDMRMTELCRMMQNKPKIIGLP